MLRIPFSDLLQTLEKAMLRLGLPPESAGRSARLFAETTCDGVYTHGLDRFPRFVATIANGSVVPDATAVCVASFGALERWDGRAGPGNVNAWEAMERAIALAREQGIGAIALANTNHWMRGGAYGWQAAEAGVMALCWTNTLPNVPAWGAVLPTVGNNPFVLAVPRQAIPGSDSGSPHVVLDIAMSQFSYGALSAYGKRGEALPVPGGFDREGRLSTDAAAIEATERALPIGFWKGSGLSLMLDLIAAMLSGGQATHQIQRDPLRETGLSQVFVAIDPATIVSADSLARTADAVIAHLHAAMPVDPGRPVRYPGEHTLEVRAENMRLGVPVTPEVWEQVAGLAQG